MLIDWNKNSFLLKRRWFQFECLSKNCKYESLLQLLQGPMLEWVQRFGDESVYFVTNSTQAKHIFRIIWVVIKLIHKALMLKLASERDSVQSFSFLNKFSSIMIANNNNWVSFGSRDIIEREKSCFIPMCLSRVNLLDVSFNKISRSYYATSFHKVDDEGW